MQQTVKGAPSSSMGRAIRAISIHYAVCLQKRLLGPGTISQMVAKQMCFIQDMLEGRILMATSNTGTSPCPIPRPDRRR